MKTSLGTLGKSIITTVAFVMVASPTIPPLAPFAMWLEPIGTFLLGALHVQVAPPVAK